MALSIPESVLWVFGSTFEDAFLDLDADYKEVIKQTDFKNAEGKFADFQGYSLFGFDREVGETDPVYARRVIRRIVGPRVDETGIAKTLKDILGLKYSQVLIRSAYGSGTFITNDFYSTSKTITVGDNNVVAAHILGPTSQANAYVAEIYKASTESISHTTAEINAILAYLSGAGVGFSHVIKPQPTAMTHPNIVSFWPMDAAFGDRLDIYSRNHIVQANPTYADTGYVDDAADLDMAATPMLSKTSPNLRTIGDGDFTLAFLVKFPGATPPSAETIIVGKGPYGGALKDYAFAIGVDTSGDGFISMGDGTSATRLTNTSGSMASGNWYCVIAMFREGTSMQISVTQMGGIANAPNTLAYTTKLFQNTDPLHVGISGDQCLLDQMSYYNGSGAVVSYADIYNANGAVIA